MKVDELDRAGVLRRLRAHHVLLELRGRPPVDVAEIAAAIVGVEAELQCEVDELAGAGFVVPADAEHFELDLGGGLTVCLEPKVLGGWYLAVYRGRELVTKRKLEIELQLRAAGDVDDVEHAGDVLPIDSGPAAA